MNELNHHFPISENGQNFCFEVSKKCNGINQYQNIVQNFRLDLRKLCFQPDDVDVTLLGCLLPDIEGIFVKYFDVIRRLIQARVDKDLKVLVRSDEL